jgi:hypothetical protein
MTPALSVLHDSATGAAGSILLSLSTANHAPSKRRDDEVSGLGQQRIAGSTKQPNFRANRQMVAVRGFLRLPWAVAEARPIG